jgi:membrane protease YdiL (CAAX protease family)
MVALLLLAALPFAVKAVTMFGIGATTYGLQSLYKLAQVCSPAAWRFAHGERGWGVVWPAKEPRPSLRLLSLGVVSGVLLGGTAIVGALVLAPAFGLDPVTIRAGFDANFDVDGFAVLGVAVFLSFANSAIEEMHFRVWLDGEASKRWGNAAGIALSASAFAAMHGFILLGFEAMPAMLAVLVTACLAGAGACWSLMVRRSGGVYAAWVSHALCDALLLGWGLFWLGYF